MWIICLVFGALFAIGGAAFLVYKTTRFVKDESLTSLDKQGIQLAIFAYAALAVGGGLIQGAINIANEWKMNAIQAGASVFGMGMFFLTLSALITNFYLHYYKPSLREDQAKWITRLMFLSIAGTIISVLILGEGVADFLTYPLPNGFSISGEGFEITTSAKTYGGLHITFYGILIVIGAYVAYAISDHKMYQKFGQHGVFDDTLVVAFLSGIVSARIGYVIGNWNGDATGGINFSEEVAKGNVGALFAVWNGGLTVIAGALGGIIVGALYFWYRHRSIGALTAVDVAVPTILWGQIIGRWGNFFNKEVYGASVSASSLSFLPTWINNQMSAGGGNVYVPLFLLEGVLNLIGYFIIVYGVGKLLKKWLVRGDLGGCYFIWYGTIRTIMEPMRDPTYNMGTDGSWSSVWSILFIVGGVLWIVGLHLFDYFYHTKGKHPRVIPSYQGVLEYQWDPKRGPLSIRVDQNEKTTDTTGRNIVQVMTNNDGDDVPLSEGKDEPLTLKDPEEK